VPPRLGIDYEQLRLINPRLIYCAVSGYGETGPLKDKAGFDQVLQTITGMCSEQGKRGGPPEVLGGSVVDYYAAALVAGGVASALYERERSGEGQFVGVSLMRAALTMQSARLVWAEGEPRDIERDMRSGGVTGIHPTGDGHLYLSANTPRFWRALCEKTGLMDAARRSALRHRAQARPACDEIVPRLHAALAARSALQWEAHFGDDVPCAAARPLARHVRPPAGAGPGHDRRIEHPVVGSYQGFTRPIGVQPHAGPRSRLPRRGAGRSDTEGGVR
jgi:crotonobetainyl-CoA:carnitine CoA-transferase CaiB-like acyl-CoA transferase